MKVVFSQISRSTNCMADVLAKQGVTRVDAQEASLWWFFCVFGTRQLHLCFYCFGFSLLSIVLLSLVLIQFLLLLLKNK